MKIIDAAAAPTKADAYIRGFFVGYLTTLLAVGLGSIVG